jgi:hypothetical protein
MQKPRRACRIREAEDSRGGTSNSITDREKAFVAGADICKFHSESEGEGLLESKKELFDYRKPSPNQYRCSQWFARWRPQIASSLTAASDNARSGFAADPLRPTVALVSVAV